MKGIILAGGQGSRLRPVTHVLNKNLLPIYDKPAIYYSLDLFRRAGITEVCIIAEYSYIENYKTLLGNGTDFDLKLHFESDTPNKKGPAQAIKYAKNFIGNDNVTVVFADGVYDTCIKDVVINFTSGAMIFISEVEDPSQYGIIEISKDGNVLSIEEKPENPKSNLAFTGLAIYDNNLFDYIDRIKPGISGEYYTTDIDVIYLQNKKLKAQKIDGFWQDIGTFDGLFIASKYWYDKKHKA